MNGIVGAHMSHDPGAGSRDMKLVCGSWLSGLRHSD